MTLVFSVKCCSNVGRKIGIAQAKQKSYHDRKGSYDRKGSLKELTVSTRVMVRDGMEKSHWVDSRYGDRESRTSIIPCTTEEWLGR